MWPSGGRRRRGRAGQRRAAGRGTDPADSRRQDRDRRRPSCYYGDDRKGGSTQFIAASNIPDFGRLRARLRPGHSGHRRPRDLAGRRPRVHGRRGGSGLRSGCRLRRRDPVVRSSRRHAEIVAGDSGYVVTDTSTNGLFVERRPRRGYADSRTRRRAAHRARGVSLLRRCRRPACRCGCPALRPPGARRPAVRPPAGTPLARLRHRAHQTRTSRGTAVRGQPRQRRPPSAAIEAAALRCRRAPDEAAPPRSGPVTRASVASRRDRDPEVIGGGVLRGEHYAITTVLAHLGRGEHNDVVSPRRACPIRMPSCSGGTACGTSPTSGRPTARTLRVGGSMRRSGWARRRICDSAV